MAWTGQAGPVTLSPVTYQTSAPTWHLIEQEDVVIKRVC